MQKSTTASEVDHHARPLAARWRGRNERGERGRNELKGHFRRDFSKGLPKGLLEGPKHYCVFKSLRFGCLWYPLRETDPRCGSEVTSEVKP